jgi:hypothetical protein
MLLALHTIVKIPSGDLAPAVTPLLASKALLKHRLYVQPTGAGNATKAQACDTTTNHSGDLCSSSRFGRRYISTIDVEASQNVFFGGGRFSFIGHDTDHQTGAGGKSRIHDRQESRLSFQRGVRSIGSKEEALFLCEHVINIASDRLEERGQMLLECIGVLGQIVSSPHGRDWYVHWSDRTLTASGPQVSEFIGLALLSTNIDEPAGGGEWNSTCRALLMD